MGTKDILLWVVTLLVIKTIKVGVFVCLQRLHPSESPVLPWQHPNVTMSGPNHVTILSLSISNLLFTVSWCLMSGVAIFTPLTCSTNLYVCCARNSFLHSQVTNLLSFFLHYIAESLSTRTVITCSLIQKTGEYDSVMFFISKKSW